MTHNQALFIPFKVIPQTQWKGTAAGRLNQEETEPEKQVDDS